MAYNNGMQNAPAASQLPFLNKFGQVPDRGRIDDALPNAWEFFADNAAGTAKVPFLVPTDANNQSALTNPNGVLAFAVQVVQLATPAAPTITTSGTAGATTVAYKIVARNGFGPTTGSTPASSAGQTTTANATLSATNFNIVTFAKVSGAAFYDIYRTSAGGTPSTTGLIGTVTANRTGSNGTQPATYTFNDTGLVGDGTTAPTANTTGSLSVPVLAGDIKIPTLTTPVNVVATPQGTTGATTITYKVVARGQVGTTAASSAATTTTANATLTAGNNVLVTWDIVPDAVSYDVYRTAAGGTPNSTGLIGNVLAPTTSLTDTGLAGDSTTPPTTNTTGALSLGRIDDSNGNAEIILTATASAVNQLTVANAATGSAPTITATGSDTNIGITLDGKGTGTVTVGNSASAQTTAVGNGAGAPTVTLANASTAGATVTVAGAATAAAATDTVNVATGNAAATGFKKVNVLTGTPGTNGNNQFIVGGSVASAKATINAAFTFYQDGNLQLTETGANNAIAAALTDAAGNNITLAAGLIITVKLAHSLQAGANTFNLNGGGAVNLKSSRNPANNIATAYVSGGFITMMYDGTQWLDCSQ